MSGKRKSKWDQPALDSVEEPSTIPPATSKWDQPAVGSSGETSGIPPATSKWDQPAFGSGGETSGIPPATSKWDQPAAGSGGETSLIPPATSKWDQPAVGSSRGNTKTGKRWDSPSTGQKPPTIKPSGEVGSNLAAEALARITSMLATQKRQTVSEPPPQVLSPSPSVASVVSPLPTKEDPVEIKLCTADYPINDSPARTELLKGSLLAEINKKSGAILAVKGRYISPEEKHLASGDGEKPLYIRIQALLQANVDTALKLLTDLDASGGAGVLGVTRGPANTGQQHYVQDKVFIGLDQAAEGFDLKRKLQGAGNSFFDHIMKTTGARIHLRGRGSGYIEPTSGKESFEALYIYIQHGTKEGLVKAKNLCEDLVRHVHQDYESFKKTVNLYPSFNPYQGYNAYSYIPVTGLNSCEQTPLPVYSVPMAQGESVTMDTPVDTNSETTPKASKEKGQKRRFTEKISSQENSNLKTVDKPLPDLDSNSPLVPDCEEKPMVTKELASTVMKPHMPPPSFVPQVKSGMKRPSDAQLDAQPNTSSNPLNKHLLLYSDSDSDNDN